MSAYVLFFGAAVLLIGLIGLVWYAWFTFVRRSPAEQEHERALASLNDAQANQFSDEQLRQVPDTDTAWQTMVQRGNAPPRRTKRRR